MVLHYNCKYIVYDKVPFQTVSVVLILKLGLNLCVDVKCINVLYRLLQRQSSGSSVYSFNQEEIREKLQAFPGGSIDLLKQASGVAVLTVNNPSRMNAFSGQITTVNINFLVLLPSMFLSQ